MATDNEKIMKRLNSIESEMKKLKDKIIDADLILTEDDLESIQQAENDLEKGKTARIA